MRPGRWVGGLAAIPDRCVRAGAHAAGVGAAAVLDTALIGAAATLGAGSVLLEAPVAVVSSPRATAGSVRSVIRDVVGGRSTRRCSRGAGRTWIEVRDPEGPDLEQTLSAVRAVCGVEKVELHRPWSRIVVSSGPDGPGARALCRIVAEAENESGTGTSGHRPTRLPGDDSVVATRVAAAAISTLGLGAALVGRSLRLPRLPAIVPSAVIAIDYQPRLRRLVERAVGPDATGLLFAAASAAAYTLTVSPESLAVEAARHGALVAEAWSGRRAWQQREPKLIAAVDGPPQTDWQPDRTTGPVERYSERAGLVGLGANAAMGAVTHNPRSIGTATLVAAPKATRAARELFASTLARGLTDRHDVFPLFPAALRRLDRIDAVVIDPRILYTRALTVSRVVGVRDRERVRVWDAARTAVHDGALLAGWHPVATVVGTADADPEAQVLVSPVHDGYASAIIAESRRGGAEVVSVDDDALCSLRNGFDRLAPLTTSIEDTLGDVVTQLQQQGSTVLVLAVDAPRAFALADVGLGVTRTDAPPPWGAHLWSADLTGAWRLLHALPAARAVSRRGIEISVQASALGSLLMLPGIPGSGTESVTAGAALGLWTGRAQARGVLRAPLPAPQPGHEWHALPAEEVRRLLPTTQPGEDAAPAGPRTSGALSGPGAQRELRWTGGPLRFTRGFLRAVRDELDDPLTPVLATCSAASAVLGSPIDAVLVGAVLALNAGISATQRLRAETVLNRLLAVQDPPARKVVSDPGENRDTVVRADSESGHGYAETAANLLRFGDVVEVRAGEVAPADGRLLEATSVEVDESVLTGESLPVVKHTRATPGVPLAERNCMLYAGTTVLTGTAVVVVTAIGRSTETRRATTISPATAHEVGLQAQLSQLTRRAMPISFVGGALVTGLGLLRGTGLRAAVTSGVAVTVAAVPEGLPLVATLAQMSAARRLTKSAALVRVPRSVEALGRVDAVCFDKTGTLSENRLRVVAVEPVSGSTRKQLLSYAARTGWSSNGGPPDHATDIAIVAAARAESAEEDRGGRTAHLPFRSGRSFASAVSGTHLTVKGAPEVMLDAFGDTDGLLDRQVQTMAEAGLRVIAVGQRHLSSEEAATAVADPVALEGLSARGLHPVGLLGLSDTPRADAGDLLPALIEQGIAVRLITGDHPLTAVAIAAELGMPVAPEQVISGGDWEVLPQHEQERAVRTCRVFARMSPQHKVQIVQTLERIGRVCAMVGDGANDAAAIRAASVGIGVASRGSAPVYGAADVVLFDGKVGALLEALEEGRSLWRRVQAAVAVLVGGNAGEVAFALIGSAVTGRSPLNARQLLLVNMLTDALPAAALAVSATNHAGVGVGRGPDEATLLRAIAVRGATTAAGATLAWAVAGLTGGPRRAATVALVALIGTQLGQILLDSRGPLVVATVVGSLAAMMAVVSIPGVSQFLGCVPLGPLGWVQGLGSAAAATAAAALVPDLFTRVLATIPAPMHTGGTQDRPRFFTESCSGDPFEVHRRRKE